MDRLSFAIVGYGCWGQNYGRLLSHDVTDARLTAVVDASASVRAFAEQRHPGAVVFASHEEMLSRCALDLDAVIVATPASHHRAAVEDCLDAGLHVLVEKPIAVSSGDAYSIVGAAGRARRTLMVGHTTLFDPAVHYVKRLIDSGELGRLLYLDMRRTNLGPIREDVNALWDLAPHDISMLHHWIGAEPRDVAAHGASYLQPGREDIVFLYLTYPGNVVASVHVGWFEPKRVRQVTIVGDRKMAVLEDHRTEPLRVYDRGVVWGEEGARPDVGELGVRDGGIEVPHFPATEPLSEELREFVSCIQSRQAPLAGGTLALAVVKTLERAQRLLDEAGAGAMKRGEYGEHGEHAGLQLFSSRGA